MVFQGWRNTAVLSVSLIDSFFNKLWNVQNDPATIKVMEVHGVPYTDYFNINNHFFTWTRSYKLTFEKMRFINYLVIVQCFVHAGLLQKFAPASSALKHDETHNSDYDIDEMVETLYFFILIFYLFRYLPPMVTIHIRKIPIGRMISLNKNRSYLNRLVCSRLCLTNFKTHNFKLLWGLCQKKIILSASDSSSLAVVLIDLELFKMVQTCSGKNQETVWNSFISYTWLPGNFNSPAW